MKNFKLKSKILAGPPPLCPQVSPPLCPNISSRDPQWPKPRLCLFVEPRGGCF